MTQTSAPYEVSCAYTPANLLADILARRVSLDAMRRLPTLDWMAALLDEAQSLVQIGANDHSDHYNNPDPAPKAVERGWRSLLFEPMHTAFERLRRRYGNAKHVRLVNGAVCASARLRCTGHQTMWWVDPSNDTGNWGSNQSDGRCIDHAATWVHEIASLSREHLMSMQRFLEWRPAKCTACAKRLQRPLPPSCMSRLILDNTVRQTVPCVCVSQELRRIYGPISLLVIDTEGYDLEVLQQVPFGTVPIWRVVYETSHLSLRDTHAAATLMMQAGFANVLGGLAQTALSVWHHVNSSEVWRADRHSRNVSALGSTWRARGRTRAHEGEIGEQQPRFATGGRRWQANGMQRLSRFDPSLDPTWACPTMLAHPRAAPDRNRSRSRRHAVVQTMAIAITLATSIALGLAALTFVTMPTFWHALSDDQRAARLGFDQ